MFGSAGDPVASDLFQSAKVYAGELEKAAAEAKKLEATVADLEHTAMGLEGQDFSNPEHARSAEATIEDMEKTATSIAAVSEDLEKLAKASSPTYEHEEEIGAGKTYYPAMYFVDKQFEEVPSTCGGVPAEKPLISTFDGCARACDNDVHECVGFGFFGYPFSQQQQQQRPQQGLQPGRLRPRFLQVVPEGLSGYGGQGVCFLYSKMQSVTYYTKCEGGEGPVSPDKVMCFVKFSKFEGTTLKPDPSGKCDICLKEAKKADRCFM